MDYLVEIPATQEIQEVPVQLDLKAKVSIG
jgi:hypothetical protein